MKSVARQYVQDWSDSFREAVQAWKDFWFEPADPYLLGMIRLLTGWMLVYNLLVWSIDLHAFFGPHGLQPLQTILDFHRQDFVFSFWFYVPEPWITTVHWTCVGIAALFFLGVSTRVTSVLAYLITISYSQRVPIANFGLDQILGMLCLYLAIGPSGACLSVDNWWRRRKARVQGMELRSARLPSARIAMRLIQLHMCVIYFWAGVSKLKGDSWYTGEAMWQVLANQEYQTLDLTWLAWMPWVPYLISHVTVLWEMLFCVLVWVPKLRPLMLFMGALMHFGIGAFLGMWTFGLIMTYAYFAFSNPAVWRTRLGWVAMNGQRLMGLTPRVDSNLNADVKWGTSVNHSALSDSANRDLAESEFSRAAAVDATVAAAIDTSVPATVTQVTDAAKLEPAIATYAAPDMATVLSVSPADGCVTLPDADSNAAIAAPSVAAPSVGSLGFIAPNRETVPAPRLEAGGVAAFSPNSITASLQPLVAREPLTLPAVAPENRSSPNINTPVIPRQTPAGTSSKAGPSQSGEALNPESALLLVALNKAERNTLRRFFRDLDVLCRAAATTANVLTLATKIKPVAVVVAGTQLSTESLITLLEDLEDVSSAPTLALVSELQASQLTMLGFSTRLLTYPVSPGRIHQELQQMLFGDAAPTSAASVAAQRPSE
ncbi:MAG: HTTM domain-containing protein [Planctomycetaceae bacterium]